MKNKITAEWLKKNHACIEALNWFENQKEQRVIPLLEKLIKTDETEKLIWAKWLMAKVMSKIQKMQYNINATLIRQTYPPAIIIYHEEIKRVLSYGMRLLKGEI